MFTATGGGSRNLQSHSHWVDSRYLALYLTRDHRSSKTQILLRLGRWFPINRMMQLPF